MEKKGNYARYFFIIVLIGLIILAFFLIKPFFMPILGAIVISYLFYPVYGALNKKIRYKALCAALMTIVILAIIVIPLIFLTNAFVGEAIGFYDRIRETGVLPAIEKVSGYISENMGITIEAKDIIEPVSKYVASSFTGFVKGLSSRLLALFVMILLIYYFLKDGDELVKSFRNLIPMTENRKNKLVKKFKEVIGATVFGTIVTGIIQGVVGGIGLWIFGFNAPLLGGIFMVILSILPIVGPPIVWFPIALWMMLVNGDWFNGLGLMIYGFLIVSTIDNIVRPQLISTKVKMHPALILVGVLGGLVMFGVLGIILGPMVLGILEVFIQFHKEENATKS